MNIFRNDINQAVNDGKLAENNFLVQKNGDIRPLGTIGKVIWQSLSHYAWVRENLFGVDNEKLAQLLETKPASEEITTNIKYLVDKGQFTTERQELILRKIKKISAQTGVEKG